MDKPTEIVETTGTGTDSSSVVEMDYAPLGVVAEVRLGERYVDLDAEGNEIPEGGKKRHNPPKGRGSRFNSLLLNTSGF